VCVCVRERDRERERDRQREREIIHFFVVFCVVRTVHKFDFRLVINETPSK